MNLNELEDLKQISSIRSMISISTWDNIKLVLNHCCSYSDGVDKKKLEELTNFKKNKFINAYKDAKIMKLVTNGGKIKATEFGREFNVNPSSSNKRKALLNVPLFSFCFKTFPERPARAELEKWFDVHANGYYQVRGMMVDRYLDVYSLVTDGKLPFQFTDYTNLAKDRVTEQKNYVNPDLESWKNLLSIGSLTKEQVIEIIINKYPAEKREQMLKHFLLEKL